MERRERWTEEREEREKKRERWRESRYVARSPRRCYGDVVQVSVWLACHLRTRRRVIQETGGGDGGGGGGVREKGVMRRGRGALARAWERSGRVRAD
ncbi:hypothetical protein E2C01_093865 [Portunus trituberculatus]|uniref:Uncharacterized protein n=1 Tax=Portunus trituberculatus TaxID=210409 RepID=A0A5B7JQZ2_PORTR|nr:hypothetical protein [Portunus trituberculatus]